MLLDAADYADIAPLPTGRLHGFAYLADVLSPVYQMLPITGRILKRTSGPYFPDLQWDIDRLVGMGLVNVTRLIAQVDEDSSYIDADFSLHRSRAERTLSAVHANLSFARLRDFLRELASALGDLTDRELDAAATMDATWADERVLPGTVIDFGEWRARNFSSKSADAFELKLRTDLRLPRATLTPAGKIHLYVHYLKRAVNV